MQAFIDSVNAIYKTSYGLGTRISLYPISAAFSLPPTEVYAQYTKQSGTVEVVAPDGTTNHIYSYYFNRGDVPDTQQTVTLNQSGTYIVRYQGVNREHRFDAAGHVINDDKNYSFYFAFAVIENHLPLKKWTVTDVINRTLDLAEPLRRNDRVRFVLNEAQAEKFDKIIAPEFSFTKQTLRECLKEVGGFVHGEPRITPKKIPDVEYKYFQTQEFSSSGGAWINEATAGIYRDGKYYVFIAGKWEQLEVVERPGVESSYELIIPTYPDFSGVINTYKKIEKDTSSWVYEVSYDMYATDNESGVGYLKNIEKGGRHVLDNYAGWIDSNAENLVNQLDKYSGVIVEPYDGGAKSVRTENTYVRIDESNMIIATQYPIYSVDKLEYVYVDKKNKLQTVDITQWLFEKSTYDTKLKSYEKPYPYSKAYGIYYKQGSKNIAGLNFKVESAVLVAFQEYAIVNILRKATGDPELFKFKISDEALTKFPEMCFRVTYTPFYNVRVAQTKPNYKEFIRPAALIYNQQANVIESRYYGENLKGAIARLGNIEKSLTYRLMTLDQIPRAGNKFNRDYYISAVATEILPTCIKCTIGLSKDFNRLSQYIGISSVKRYYEISEKQAVDRNVLYREFIVISNSMQFDEETIIGTQMLDMIAATFNPPQTATGELEKLGPVTNVTAWGESFKGFAAPAVNLPVISSAFGNSISFSWQYEDNYSAGGFSQYVQNAYEIDGKTVAGYFQNSYSYTDYYGRLYYYNFDLQLSGPLTTATSLNYIAQRLPGGNIPAAASGVVSTIGQQPYILRKDNREALQVNFQIDFVTNIDTLIIGSALASYCPAVRGNSKPIPTLKVDARLYVLPNELNKFTDHLEAFTGVKPSTYPSVAVTSQVTGNSIEITAPAFPADGKSWAIVTPQYEISEKVETEDGNAVKQTVAYGGDLLIGQNIEVKSGQAFAPIYFTPRRNVFSKTVWKDRR